MTAFPSNTKNCQAMIRYRCEDGHLFHLVRPRALGGYAPILECPELPIHPLYVGDVCRKPAKHVGEGGWMPRSIKAREQRREALKERGLKDLPAYRRVRGDLRRVSFTAIY